MLKTSGSASFLKILFQFLHYYAFTLVNVYVDLVVFTRIAGTSKTGSGIYWF